MTSLSQYMRAEQEDRTEPASFYIPGATGWYDPRGLTQRWRPPEQILEPEENVSED